LVYGRQRQHSTRSQACYNMLLEACHESRRLTCSCLASPSELCVYTLSPHTTRSNTTFPRPLIGVHRGFLGYRCCIAGLLCIGACHGLFDKLTGVSFPISFHHTRGFGLADAVFDGSPPDFLSSSVPLISRTHSMRCDITKLRLPALHFCSAAPGFYHTMQHP
jgi:hypothetical protein